MAAVTQLIGAWTYRVLSFHSTPEHWWRFNYSDAADSVLDFGGTGGIDCLDKGSGGVIETSVPLDYENARGLNCDATRYKGAEATGDSPNISSGTVCTIFKINASSPSSDMYLLSCGSATTTGIHFYISSAKKLRCRIVNGAGTNEIEYEGSTTLSEGVEYCVHWSQPADGTGIDIYVNGVAETVSITTAAVGGVDEDTWFDYIYAIGSPEQETFLGEVCSEAGNVFDGVLNEIYVSANVITTDQVSDEHEVFETDPVYTAMMAPGSLDYWFRAHPQSTGDTAQDYTDPDSTTNELGYRAISGSFNATFRNEANPSKTGWGMLLNGQGGMYDEITSDRLSGSQQTFVAAFRTDGSTSNTLWLWGSFRGFDTDYNRLGIAGSGAGYYAAQSDSSDDDNWQGGSGLNDDAFHTLIVVMPADAITDPVMYVDGVAVSVSHSGSNVAYNYGPSSYVEDLALGYRGGVNSNPTSGVVWYDVAIFDKALSASEAADIHNAMAGIDTTPNGDFSSKPQRRSNRRRFFAF